MLCSVLEILCVFNHMLYNIIIAENFDKVGDLERFQQKKSVISASHVIIYTHSI